MNIPGAFQSEIITHIAITLAHFIWQGAILTTLYLIACRALRAAPPTLRHTLGVITLATMLLCLPITYTLINNNPLNTTRRPPQMVTTTPLAVELDSTLHETTPANPTTPLISDDNTPTPTPSPTSANPHATLLPTTPPTTPPTTINQLHQTLQNLRGLAPLITTLYAVGLAAMFLRLFLSLLATRRLRLNAQPINHPHIRAILQAQARRLKLKTTPLILACERAAIPIVVGFIKPVLLLPAQIITQLDEQQLAAILAHELAHIRRLDPLILILQRLAETLLFFHPGAWLVSNRVSLEREQACDDLALSTDNPPLDYAQTLLHIAQLAHHPPFSPMQSAPTTPIPTTPSTANALTSKPSDLRLRIIRLLNGATPTTPTSPSTLRLSPTSTLTAIALLTLALLAINLTGAAKLSDDPSASLTVTFDRTTPTPTATLSNGVTIELLAVQDLNTPGNKWFSPDGSPFNKPNINLQPQSAMPSKYSHARAFAVRIIDPDQTLSPLRIGAAKAQSAINQSDKHSMEYIKAAFNGKPDPLNLKIEFGFNNWKTLANVTPNRATANGFIHDGQRYKVMFSGATESIVPNSLRLKTDVRFTVSHNMPSQNTRIIAIDKKRRIHIAKGAGIRIGDLTQKPVVLQNIKLADIQSLEFQTAPNHQITFNNIALNPNQLTDIQIQTNLPQTNPTPTATINTTTPSPTVTFSNGTKIELLGIQDSKVPSEWWRPNGTPWDTTGLDMTHDDVGHMSEGYRERTLAVRVSEPINSPTNASPDAPNTNSSILHSRDSKSENERRISTWFISAAFKLEADALQLNTPLNFETDIAQARISKDGSHQLTGQPFNVSFSQAIDAAPGRNNSEDSEVQITMTSNKKFPQRFVAVFKDGTRRPPNVHKYIPPRGEQVRLSFYGQNLADIDHFELKIFQPSIPVTFSNIALNKGAPTNVQVEVDLPTGKIRSQNNTTPTNPNPIATFPNGVKLELVAIQNLNTPNPNWWRPDGTKFDAQAEGLRTQKPMTERSNSNRDPNHWKSQLAFAVRVLDPEQHVSSTGLSSPGASRSSSDSNGDHPFIYGKFAFSDEPDALQLHANIAFDDWKTRVRHTSPSGGLSTGFSKDGQRYNVSFSGAVDAIVPYSSNLRTQVSLTVTHNVNMSTRVIAITKNGQTHIGGGSGSGSPDFMMKQVQFRNLKLSDIKAFEFQTSPYHKIVFQDISLHPGQQTNPQVKFESDDETAKKEALLKALIKNRSQNPTSKNPTNEKEHRANVLDARHIKLLEMKRDLALKQQQRHSQFAEAGREVSFEDEWDVLKILHETTIELAAAQNDTPTLIASYQTLIDAANVFAEQSKSLVESGRVSPDIITQWQIEALDYQIKLEQITTNDQPPNTQDAQPNPQSLYNQQLQQLETKLKTNQNMYGSWHPRSVAIEKEIAALKDNPSQAIHTPTEDPPKTTPQEQLKLLESNFTRATEQLNAQTNLAELNRPASPEAQWQIIKQYTDAKVAYADAKKDPDLALTAYRDLILATQQYYQVAIAMKNQDETADTLIWMGRHQQVVNELAKRLTAKRANLILQLGAQHPRIAEVDREIKSVEAQRGC